MVLQPAIIAIIVITRIAVIIIIREYCFQHSVHLLVLSQPARELLLPENQLRRESSSSPHVVVVRRRCQKEHVTAADLQGGC